MAWIEDFPGGGDRQEIVWPPGYSARFTPSLEILDDSGVVVVRGGDYIDGHCGLQSGGRLLLAPPFMALRLDCGPLDLTTCQFYLVTATTASGWPDREIAELRFTSAGGDYDVIYEDGTTATGRTR